MDNHKVLIEKYRKSDFADRIFLFLEYRDLRPDFSAVDMADAERNREQSAEKQKSRIPLSNWLSLKKRVLQVFFPTRRPSSDNVP